ncbi:hypothetical protein [Actinomadura litoris]|uniref:hypothetical protein n=1 Tax=Actinomadura litoris TaxID=2678616 RepID=UPI001FA72471|nr:hypothetical protein [Actinomadura litoris]
MSNLINRTTRLVTPDHGLFGFCDEGGWYPEIRIPDITWFAANKGTVLISPAQDLIKSGMQFEHWSDKPDPPDNEVEREATFPFHVTRGSIALSFSPAARNRMYSRSRRDATRSTYPDTI